MDWTIGIQKAIDHIEENLTREIGTSKWVETMRRVVEMP